MTHRLLDYLLWMQVVTMIGRLHVTGASLRERRAEVADSNVSLVKTGAETFLSDKTSFNETFLDFLLEALQAKHKATVARSNTPEVPAGPDSESANVNTVPRVNGLGFEPGHKDAPPQISGVAGFPLEADDSPGGRKGARGGEAGSRNNPTHLVILLVCSFLGGIALTSSIGMVIYFYKRKRWKQRNVTVEADLNSPKLTDGYSSGSPEVTSDDDSSRRSSDSQTRQNSIGDDARNLLGEEQLPATESPVTMATTGVTDDNKMAGSPDTVVTVRGSASHVTPGSALPVTVLAESCAHALGSQTDLGQPGRPGDLALGDLCTPVTVAAVTAAPPSPDLADCARRPGVVYIAGEVGEEGGAVQSPDSDVSLIVPPGSVPPGAGPSSLELRVDLSCAALAGLVEPGLPPRPLQLSPLVQLLAPGLQHFSQPVIVKLPHRAHLPHGGPPSSGVTQHCPADPPPGEAASPCTLKLLQQLHSSTEDTQNRPQWREVPHQPASGDLCQPACFTFDKEFVFVHTGRPMTLVALGCGPHRGGQTADSPRLKMSALTYGSCRRLRESGRWRAELRVYVCDGFRDAYQRVRDEESARGGCRQSPLKELRVDPLRDLSVTLANADDPDWTWRLADAALPSKVLPSDAFTWSRSKPLHVDFLCESTFSCDQQPSFLANIVLTQSCQGNESRTERYHITVTDNFLNLSI